MIVGWVVNLRGMLVIGGGSGWVRRDVRLDVMRSGGTGNARVATHGG